MSLVGRQKRFDEMCDRFSCDQPGKLLAVYKIPPASFEALQAASMFFISKCLTGRKIVLEQNKLLEHFVEEFPLIENVTPNGKIMPKSHFMLEYNLFLRVIADIVCEMGVSDLFSYFRLPALRYKSAYVNKENVDRSYATEKPHLESWLGHSKNTITFHIPILGDVVNNFVEMFSPPDDYQESWSDPIDNFLLGERIASRYRSAGIRIQPGNLYLFEAITLHATVRTPGAGARFSTEMMGVLKDGADVEEFETGEKKKALDYAISPGDLSKIGREVLFGPLNSFSGAIEKKTELNIGDGTYVLKDS